MVFIPSVSTFAISKMLGGGTEMLLGDLIEQQYMGGAYNPYLGAAISLVMMVIVVICMVVMNRFGEDILPEEVAYVMEDKATGSTGNGAFAAAAAGCCGYPCWQAWMDLKDLRAQIHDGCSVAVRVERRVRGQRDSVGVWMGLRGFGHDDAVLSLIHI